MGETHPHHQAFLHSLTAYWPFITAIVVAGWVAFTWLADQRKAAELGAAEAAKQGQVRLFEAKRPFLIKKQDLYFETMKLADVLVWAEPSGKMWQDTASHLLGLRYSEMQMVGSASTRAFMRGVLIEIAKLQEKPKGDIWPLRGAIECLADALRRSLAADWSDNPESGQPAVVQPVAGDVGRVCRAPEG